MCEYNTPETYLAVFIGTMVIVIIVLGIGLWRSSGDIGRGGCSDD